MTIDSSVKLTVCVVTYNQCDYIRTCLESILSQVTDFYFDVLIGDDCSSDGTTEIVREFERKYPERVKALVHGENVGAVANYRAVHLAAVGKFVAHIDGDDYMLPGKLQEQTDALEKDNALAAVFHKLTMVDVSGESLHCNWPESAPKKIFTEFLLCNHPVVGHSAMMYRKGFLSSLLTADYDFIDFRVYFELSLKGSLGYIDKPLGAYRVGVGISSKNKYLDRILEVVDAADLCGELDKDIVRKARASLLFRASLNEFYSGNFAAFSELVERSADYQWVSKTQQFFFYLRGAPRAILVIDRMYKAARRWGLVKDMKMTFRS